MSKSTAMIVLFFGFICLPIGGTIRGYYIINETLQLVQLNTEAVTISDGTGYAFILLPFPVLYLTFFPAFKRFQKFMFKFIIIYGVIGLLFTPRVINYFLTEKLIDSGYTYCGYKRLGSVRYTRRLWLKDPTCDGQISNIETRR